LTWRGRRVARIGHRQIPGVASDDHTGPDRSETTMSSALATAPSQPPVAGRVLPRRISFWLVAATMAVTLAASSAPSPLYPVLQAKYGFSTIMLTVIFAVYVMVLLLSLLTVGGLSDVLGRRPVLAAALVVEAVAMALYLASDGTAWLLAARAVQGLATGAAVGALGAYLLDLQPAGGSRLGSLVTSAASTLGLGLGAILTGVLVQYAPDPTRLVFAILAATFLLLSVVTVVMPETVRPVRGALRALRPQVAVPFAARRAFTAAVPTMTATWALLGLILSIGGSLLATTFGQTNHAVVGALLGLFAASGAAAALVARDLAVALMTRLGTIGLIAGTAVFLAALAMSSLTLFILASVVAGSGFGTAFLGALRAVTELVRPHERAALLSAVYVVSYLAFSVPAVISGLLTTEIGLRSTALAYGGFVTVVAVLALVYQVRGRQDARASEAR
jgi:MFS family permease